MTTHTQGPWHVAEEHESAAVIRDNGGKIICSVRNGYGIKLPEDAQQKPGANARLIAAAPDLLYACKLMLAEMESRFDYTKPTEDEQAAMDAAQDAIDKAEPR